MTPPAAWATTDDLPSSSVVGMLSDGEWDQVLDWASGILWALSGRRWRGSSTTASAVLRAAPPQPGQTWPYHRSWGQCGCYSGYSGSGWGWLREPSIHHHAPARVRLPHPDVVSVTSVTIDGAPFTAWRSDGAWLTRTDGRGWPVCGNVTDVTYLHGLPPPEGGVAACVELAIELARSRSANPDQACKLPQRLTSITRQGISFAALDDLSFLEKGLTGLYTVDLWISSVNPSHRPQRATVWSPELVRARRNPS